MNYEIKGSQNECNIQHQKLKPKWYRTSSIESKPRFFLQNNKLLNYFEFESQRPNRTENMSNNPEFTKSIFIGKI